MKAPAAPRTGEDALIGLSAGRFDLVRLDAHCNGGLSAGHKELEPRRMAVPPARYSAAEIVSVWQPWPGLFWGAS